MSGKLRLLFWIGILVILLPYLGITNGLRTAITIFLGVLIVWMTFRLRHHYKELRYRLRRSEEPSLAPEITTTSS